MTDITLLQRQSAILYFELLELPVNSGAYASTMRFHERLRAGRNVAEDDLAVAMHALHEAVEQAKESVNLTALMQGTIKGLRENIEGKRHSLILHNFDGFYHSHHDELIDQVVEQMFTDEDGDEIGGGGHIDGFSLTREMVNEYCAAYVELVKDHMRDKNKLFLPSMRLEEVISPREYNFDTDRIVVSIAQADFNKLAAVEVDTPAMQDLAREMFTPRSGFVPFYSADIADWKEKPIEEWDANELGVLLKSAASEPLDDASLLEGSDTFRDQVDEIIYKHLPEKSRIAIDSRDATQHAPITAHANQEGPSL